MKPQITPAMPHAAWLKLTLSEVNASILTDSYSSLTSLGLILSLGPQPSDVNLWFSNIYKPKSSFFFPFASSFAAPWSDLFSVTIFLLSSHIGERWYKDYNSYTCISIYKCIWLYIYICVQILVYFLCIYLFIHPSTHSYIHTHAHK